jgi:hypothetical protein
MCLGADISHSHSHSRSIINTGSGGSGNGNSVADSSSTEVVAMPLAHNYQLSLVNFMLLLLTAIAECVA